MPRTGDTQELQAILKEIQDKKDESSISKDVRKWTHEDIDKLLEETKKENEQSGGVDNSEYRISMDGKSKESTPVVVMKKKFETKDISQFSGSIRNSNEYQIPNDDKDYSAVKSGYDISDSDDDGHESKLMKSIISGIRREKKAKSESKKTKIKSSKIMPDAKNNDSDDEKEESKTQRRAKKDYFDWDDEANFDFDFDDKVYDKTAKEKNIEIKADEPEKNIYGKTDEFDINDMIAAAKINNEEDIHKVNKEPTKKLMLDDNETESVDVSGNDDIQKAIDDTIKIYLEKRKKVSENEAAKKQNTATANAQPSENDVDGQIVLNGFEKFNDVPVKISEIDAEQKLFEKRREKIRQFTLFGADSESEIYDSDENEKIGELFDSPDIRSRRKETEKTFTGVEYEQPKDSRRVLRYLSTQSKKSLKRLITLAVLLGLSIIVGIASAAGSTISGDRILTIFFNFVIISAALITSNQMIFHSFEMLKKKRVNINTAISFAAVFALLQNLLMFVLYFLDANTVSVFSGTGVVLLFLSEVNEYITLVRTLDAMKLCTGKNKDKLYSIEGISDDKDAMELGRIVKSPSPRIRFSSKINFPAHVVELCTSETSLDKMMKLILPVIAVMSIVNLIVSWIVKSDFATGFAAFTITMTMCVPAYGALLIQFPLFWMNKQCNSAGSMIACQDSVNEICRTNAIMIESRDLFDQHKCSVRGFKDFKTVRVDDAMLYASAMIIRSGGPLMGAFDQVIASKRDVLPVVKSLNYEEKLGLSGWILGQKVILGNRALMVNHNIEIPESIDEGKYQIDGFEVMFLAIAHKLSAMIVLKYEPNEKIVENLKKLRDSGVTILVRNNDPIVTETMISDCYDMRLDNIRILNSSAGRIFKKYKSKPKLASRAVSIHDASVGSFMSSLCSCAAMKHAFRFSNLILMIGVMMSFAIMLILSICNVVADLPAVFAILLQILAAGLFVGGMRLLSSK